MVGKEPNNSGQLTQGREFTWQCIKDHQGGLGKKKGEEGDKKITTQQERVHTCYQQCCSARVTANIV